MHLSNQAIESRLGFISDGPAGIHETLVVMRDFVRDGKKLMSVRGKAIQLTNGLAQKDWTGEIRKLHAYVRDCIRYVGDVTDVETVQTPDATLRIGAGDCDDKSVLLCALLESLGHPTKFVAIGFTPGVYEHVYCETKVGERWIALEATEPVEAGWEPQRRTPARMEMVN
jgi:transglutaminase-like putative cysteine protease